MIDAYTIEKQVRPDMFIRKVCFTRTPLLKTPTFGNRIVSAETGVSSFDDSNFQIFI